MLRVVAWNMGHWAHRRQAVDAWRYLDKVLAPDIALLQECAIPKTRQTDRHIYREIGGTRKWGAAVHTSSLALAPIHLSCNSHPGSLVVAEVTVSNRPIVLVSMYGELDAQGYAITSLHRMLSDLTHLLDGKMKPGGRPEVVIGGDFNASPQYDDRYRTKTHRLFFDRLQAFGLVDCLGPFTADRVRTLRHGRSRVPWVNDYVFATKRLAARATGQVIEEPAMLALSDHNPVVVSFNI